MCVNPNDPFAIHSMKKYHPINLKYLCFNVINYYKINNLTKVESIVSMDTKNKCLRFLFSSVSFTSGVYQEKDVIYTPLQILPFYWVSRMVAFAVRNVKLCHHL